jgi:thermitase
MMRKSYKWILYAISLFVLAISLGFFLKWPNTAITEEKLKLQILQGDIAITEELGGQLNSLKKSKFSLHQQFNLRLQELPNDGQKYGIQTLNNAKQKSHYVMQEVIVKFTNEPSVAQLQTICKHINASYPKKLDHTYLFQSKTYTTEQLLDFFDSYGTNYAEPHYIYVTNTRAEQSLEPNDEYYERYQWNLPIIGTSSGWKLSRGHKQVIIAVVDTGVAMTHPDLQNRLIEGYNTLNPESPPEDDVGHGTHVMGIISALTDNRLGIAGMTWFNQVMPVKVLDGSGLGSTYSVAEGIIWATDHGAQVINMSLGNYADAQFLHDAIRYAFNKNVILIAATGNDNTNQPGYPAAYPEVFAVSATNQDNKRAIFANYGDYVDVVAPGEHIASTYIGDQYASLSGTSMASPHVAALAALIRSAHPNLTNTEIYDIMRQSAVDLGPKGKDRYYGYGQIHIHRALQVAANPTILSETIDPNNDSLVTSQTNESNQFIIRFEKWLRSLLGI